MKTYIALLRGINVGGHRKIPMAELRSLLEKIGLENVQTYIQSGNVVFQSSEDESIKIEALIKKAIFEHFNFDVPTLVKTPAEIQMVLDACPFPEEYKLNSYFTLLQMIPDSSLIAAVSDIKYPNEEFFITPKCIYFYSTVGYGNAKYSNSFFEKKLKVPMTARNYRTLMKLLAMSAN